jgi:signal transduction histidine kinase
MHTDPVPWKPLALWRHPGRLLRGGGRIALSLPIGIITFVLMVVLGVLSIALIPVFLLGIPMAAIAFMVARGLGRIERSRAAAFEDAPIRDPIPPLTRPTRLGRVAERLKSKPRWREIGYHVALLPVGVLNFCGVAVLWGGALALAAMPFYVGSLPGGTAKLYFFEIGEDGGAWPAAAVGLVGLAWLAPWLTLVFAKGQAMMARALLGPTHEAELAAQVMVAETGRTAAVDSAEAERRRIERDLHDGAQQRLVALAANLGTARERLDDDPAAGKEMVAVAHEEAKAALAEIRDLVRGIHPVILEDRGLDAALSAVVARSSVPVSLDVHVAHRPPPAAESAAYFVVNEALTNVARHARATRAHVSIARAGDRLVVEVRDDGIGGADPALGSGLQGLRDRVAGLGGSMYVISPAGGPTTISVELPCGS